jgi:hypothetical protein
MEQQQGQQQPMTPLQSHPQPPQVGAAGPQQIPNGMMRVPMGGPMNGFPPQMQYMNNNPGMNMQMGQGMGPQPGHAMSPGMNHPGAAGMMPQQMTQVSIHFTGAGSIPFSRELI